MSKIDLLPDEAILKQDSQIAHEKTSGRGSWQSELILTNLALIVIHKGAFGGVKEVLRFPLDQVKVAGGIPQVVAGRSSCGERQVQVYFLQSIEAFSLGISDEDDESSLKDLFTPQAAKEKHNVEEWRTAICQAVQGNWNYDPLKAASSVSQSRGAIGSIVGAIGSSFGVIAPSLSGISVAPAAPCATARCIGCRAPISGIRGQKMMCGYCDTEQVIQ